MHTMIALHMFLFFKPPMHSLLYLPFCYILCIQIFITNEPYLDVTPLYYMTGSVAVYKRIKKRVESYATPYGRNNFSCMSLKPRIWIKSQSDIITWKFKQLCFYAITFALYPCFKSSWYVSFLIIADIFFAWNIKNYRYWFNDLCLVFVCFMQLPAPVYPDTSQTEWHNYNLTKKS